MVIMVTRPLYYLISDINGKSIRNSRSDHWKQPHAFIVTMCDVQCRGNMQLHYLLHNIFLSLSIDTICRLSLVVIVAVGNGVTTRTTGISTNHDWVSFFGTTLRWRHNDHTGVSNHQPHHCLLNRLFRRRSKKTSKLRVTGLCAGNSPGPVNSPHKGPVTRNMFPFDDVIMIYSIKYGHRFVMICCGHAIISYLVLVIHVPIFCRFPHRHSELRQSFGLPKTCFKIKMPSYQYRKPHC